MTKICVSYTRPRPKVDLAGIAGDQLNSVLAASAVTALNGGDIADADRFVTALNNDSPTSEEERLPEAATPLRTPTTSLRLAHSTSRSPRIPLTQLRQPGGSPELNRLLPASRTSHVSSFCAFWKRNPNDLRTLGSLEQLVYTATLLTQSKPRTSNAA